VVWLGTDLTAWALAVPAMGLGLGMGTVLGSLMGASLSEVPPRLAGAASGLVNTVVQLATATGIALFGTVFFSRLDGAEYVAATATTMAVSVGVLLVGLALTATLPKVRVSV
jgi:hypothetical protein